MPVSRRHALQQGPMIRTLLETAVSGLRPGRRPEGPPQVPGPEHTATVPPRPRGLVDDFITASGGTPANYKGVVPGHLFSQWGFPLLAKTLRDLPYPLARGLNGGARIEMHRPLPDDEPLQLRGWLDHIDDNDRRAVLKTRLVTSTASVPDAVTATMYAVIPLKRGSGGKKTPALVPTDATEIGRREVLKQDAVDYALLTGDVNPVHWLTPYAKMFGFPSTILHGFATLSYLVETLVETRLEGQPSRLAVIDVKFTKPVVLPRSIAFYVKDDAVAVGHTPDEPAFLTGTFSETPTHG
ncbi:MAG: MaoC/PaaZ C-terminal domain-containing protein [Myxococcota bacterium]